jgi:hypothetical protein
MIAADVHDALELAAVHAGRRTKLCGVPLLRAGELIGSAETWLDYHFPTWEPGGLAAQRRAKHLIDMARSEVHKAARCPMYLYTSTCTYAELATRSLVSAQDRVRTGLREQGVRFRYHHVVASLMEQRARRCLCECGAMMSRFDGPNSGGMLCPACDSEHFAELVELGEAVQ